MCFKRKEKPQTIGNQKQNRQRDTEILSKTRRARGFLRAQKRWNQKRERRQKKQSSLKPGSDSIVFLHVIPESSEQEGRSEHEQRIGDDCTGDGSLDQHVLSGLQCDNGNDELGEISERGVEQTAD